MILRGYNYFKNFALYNQDCIEGMKDYPDKYFELAICDPPYGIGEGQGQYKSRNANRVDKRNGKPIVLRHKGYASKEWDNEPPEQIYYDQLFRISKKIIIWGSNHLQFNQKSTSSGRIVWDKVNGDSDFSDCEIGWTNGHGSTRQVVFMWCGFIQGKSIKEGRMSQGNKALCERRIHPTQKPVKLYEWILKNYAKAGDKILDTHLGSGSSVIACYNLDFHITGFELDEEYFMAMEKRIKHHIAQRRLFDAV